MTKTFGMSWALLMALAADGCSTPSAIQGRKVLGTLQVEGRKAYILEPREGDKRAARQTLQDSAKATDGIVFHPVVPPRN